MADSEVRRKLLTYLHQLPDDQSVQPGDLPTAVGLPANQVTPSLRAAKKRGEVETLEDGSVRLNSATRKGFRNGKVPFGSRLPDALAVPLHILNQAISQVSAVKYALGVAGIAGAGAIVYLLLGNLQNASVWLIAGLVVGGILILMVLLFVFAKLTESPSPQAQSAGIVLMWFVLLLFMVVCILLTSSVFFRWPRDIRDYLLSPPQVSTQTPPKMFSILPDTTSLPDSVFPAKDLPTKPRQWEKYLTIGLRQEFKNPLIVYLVTQPFPAPYGSFTLYVNMNTSETVLPVAFLARLEADQTILMPLPQADHRQGPRTEYRYAVPAINRYNDRLIVILGMEHDTYDHISQATKFVLSSQPLSQ